MRSLTRASLASRGPLSRALRAARTPAVVLALAFSLPLPFAAGCHEEPALLGEHLRRGDEALADGRYAQALTAYNHARELAPTSDRVQRALMWARVTLMADTPDRVSTDALEDVAYEAELFLTTPPAEKRAAEKDREVTCLSALGNLLARKGDFEGARAKLAEALRADPTSSIAHGALGALLATRPDQQVAARMELELALKDRPTSVAPLVGLARIALATGDLPGAADKLELALRKSDDPLVRTLLGNARLQQGKHAEAAEHFQRAAVLDPRSADALSGLGQARLGEGRLEEAERALRAAAQLRQDEPTSTALGFTLTRLKRPEQALVLFGQVLAQNAAAAPALFGAGLASEDLGRPEQALDFYRRVLVLTADSAQGPVVKELQKQAREHIAALPAPAAPASASASASAAPGSPVTHPRH